MTRSVLIFLVVAVFVVYSCEAQRCPGGLHDVRVNCGSSCEPSCSQPNPLVCTANCIINACRCDKGYVRRESDQRCVLIGQCRFRPRPVRPLYPDPVHVVDQPINGVQIVDQPINGVQVVDQPNNGVRVVEQPNNGVYVVEQPIGPPYIYPNPIRPPYIYPNPIRPLGPERSN